MTVIGDLLMEFKERPRTEDPEVLTLTEKKGFVRQRERFNKRLATDDISGYKIVRRNDIAFNPYLLWAGAVAQNTIIDTGAISPLYPTFRVREGFDPGYVGKLLLSPNVVASYDTIAFGSVPRRRRSSVDDFLALPVVTPPNLDEQRRIAAILDHADSVGARRSRSLERMSDLVSAEFTRQFGGEHGLPMEPLENVLVSITNGRSPICESRPRVDAEWGVLKLGAVSSGSYRAAENKAYLGDRRPSDIEVRTGDVLMVRKNTPELVGAVTLVHATPPRLLLPDLVFRLEANHSKLTGTYLTHALMSPVLRDRVRGLASGSARSMSNISMAKLRSLHVPVPPLADQLAFEAFVENVASRRQRFEQSLSRFDSLLASLQARAFAGDL